jgi:hypothetical protein
MHIQDKDLVERLGEQTPLVAAVYARVDTVVGLARWLGPLGNYLVARPAARAAAHRQTKRTNVPLDAAVVLGLSEDDLHVWSADPMLSQVHDHLGSIERSRLTAMRTEPAKSWAPLTFEVDREPLELQARGDVSGFVAAFKRA